MSRGNPLRGEAHFVIDGEEYHLVLDNHAWIGVENVLGVAIGDVIEAVSAAIESGKNPMMKHACAIVYGGLYRNHPKVTEDWVIDHIFDPEIKAAMMQAFAGAQPPDLPDDDSVTGGSAEGNAAAAKPKKAGTGNGSSSPGAKQASRRKSSGGKRREA